MTELSPVSEAGRGARRRKPPTFTGQTRICFGCAHFLDGSCRHPKSEWHGGLFNSRELRTPDRRWPKKEPWEWCGWWRPAMEGDAP